MSKTVKAKVLKPKRKQRTTKGVEYPYEVWSVDDQGYYYMDCGYKTKGLAEKAIRRSPNLMAPVIVHIVIPPMEY